MVGIDKVNPVYPNWKVNPAGDKKDQKQDKEQEAKQKRKEPNDQPTDDGRPHIDEYA